MAMSTAHLRIDHVARPWMRLVVPSPHQHRRPRLKVQPPGPCRRATRREQQLASSAASGVDSALSEQGTS